MTFRLRSSEGCLVLTGGERKRVQPSKNRSAAFKANGGTREGHLSRRRPGIDDLIANCDKAGGGLSTEPDGGVDCYVGIHDQP